MTVKIKALEKALRLDTEQNDDSSEEDGGLNMLPLKTFKEFKEFNSMIENDKGVRAKLVRNFLFTARHFRLFMIF